MPEETRLTVVASSIDGRGTAKLDPESFSRLKLGQGMKVLVTYGAKSREMSAVPDTIYGEGTIRLMRQDMEYLRVQEGTVVIVSRKNGATKPAGKAPAPKGGKKGKKRGKKKGGGNAASLDRF